MDVERLPSWATLNDEGKIEVDPDTVYPLFLDALGYPGDNPTRDELETARRCFTESLIDFLGHGEFIVKIIRRDRWALKNFVPDDYVGVTFRPEYERIKEDGRIPG